MYRLDDIKVKYEFKSDERRLLHLAFKAIRNGVPLYIDSWDYEANKEMFSRCGGRRKGTPSRVGDGKKFSFLRREYRHRLEE